VRFFDAHCDTIGKIWEGGADFAADPPDGGLHVTLPGLRAAGVWAQVFASWVFSQKYRGCEFEVGLAKVEAVRRLCHDHPADLVLVEGAAQLGNACRPLCAGVSTDPAMAPAAAGRADLGDRDARIAIIAGLEGADPLQGDVDNLAVFYRAGVRLLTLAWGDNNFCGAVHGDGRGLTTRGVDLVAACEEQGVLVDVSHASDQAFVDICRVATRPFVASHSNCRSLCPSPRNLTDKMICAVAERGGVVGISVVPGFLSADFYEQTREAGEEFWSSVAAGTATVEEAGRKCSAAEALVPRPPLELIVDHVLWAINVGGEDAVGLGGDLDGVDVLPLGLDGVAEYPRIAELLGHAGLTAAQVDKVCYGNFARIFVETLD
jgi:membrane dipeptidase